MVNPLSGRAMQGTLRGGLAVAGLAPAQALRWCAMGKKWGHCVSCAQVIQTALQMKSQKCTLKRAGRGLSAGPWKKH